MNATTTPVPGPDEPMCWVCGWFTRWCGGHGPNRDGLPDACRRRPTGSIKRSYLRRYRFTRLCFTPDRSRKAAYVNTLPSVAGRWCPFPSGRI
jgi:hypothetical protein